MNGPRELPATDSTRVTIGARGANSEPPRSISSFGMLQGFWRRKDETSPDNALRLALGSLHWDLRYSNKMIQVVQGPVEVRA